MLKLKRLSIILVLLMLLVLTFVACEPDVEPTPEPPNNQITVQSSVEKALGSIDNSLDIINADSTYHIDLAADCSFKGNDYFIVLRANLDPTGENNSANKVAFEVRKVMDSEYQVYFGFYYNNGTAYLNIPSNEGEKIYIEDTNLSRYIKDLTPKNPINNAKIANLLATIMSDVEHSQVGNDDKYVFSFDLSSAYNTIVNFINTDYIPIDLNMILGMFGYSMDDISQEFSNGYNNCNLTFTISDKQLKGLAFDNNNGTSFNLHTIKIYNKADTVTLPDYLNTFVEHSPTNFDLDGKITLDVTGGQYKTILDGVTIDSDLEDARYEFDLKIRAKTSLFVPEKDKILIELSRDDNWSISLYYDGKDKSIYADLTQINAGKIKMPGEQLQIVLKDIIKFFCETKEIDSAGELVHFLKLLGIASPGVNIDGNGMSIIFDTQMFTEMLDALGIIPPFEIESTGVDIVREGLDVKSVFAWFETGGLRFELETDNINLGPSPVIPVPSNLDEYADMDTLEVYNMELSGEISLNNPQNIIEHLEKILSYLSDSDIVIMPEYNINSTTLHYHGNIGIGRAEGSLETLDIMLYDLEHRFLVGVGYLASTDKLYIISQEDEYLIYDEYNLNYDDKEFIEHISGIANPREPDDAPKVGLTNTLSNILLDVNYNAFVKFVNFIGLTVFDAQNVWDPSYIFDNAKISIGEDFAAEVVFNNGNSIDLIAKSFRLGYEPVRVVGIEEDSVRLISSVYNNNDMPIALNLIFADGSKKFVKVNEWYYDTEGYVNSQDGTVIAYTELFGERIEIELRIAGSSYTFSRPTELPEDGKTYDKNDLMIDPIADILSINGIDINLPNGKLTKELTWDLSALEDANDNGNYGIQGIVYDFFGRPIFWPSKDTTYQIGIVGMDIEGHRLDKDVDAYNTGFDPRDPLSYPDSAYLNPLGIITTDSNETGQLLEIYWDLSNIIALYEQPNFHPYISGIDEIVLVNVPNAFGVDRWLEVNVKMHPAKMIDVSFQGVNLGNGKLIDEGINVSPDASGISWDNINSKLVINPLIINKLSEDILPASVIMSTAVGDFIFHGLKWEIVPMEINNNGGEYGLDNYRLNLILGDSIGGYQQVQIALEVLNIAISNFELLNDNGEIIETSDQDTRHKLYEIDNPYNYEIPSKIKIFTRQGDFVIDTAWDIPGFSVNSLYNGGTFLASYMAGSEELKMTIDFKAANAQSEHGLNLSDYTDIHFEKGRGLVFNPYTSADFTDIDIYPTKALGIFTDGIGNQRELEIPIRWDISNITNLFSDTNPNLYNGTRKKVYAYTNYDGCGEQKFEIEISIEEAKFDKVAYSQDDMSMILDLNIFIDENGSLAFADPRLQSSYPEELWVSYKDSKSDQRIIPMESEYVSVASWNLSNIVNAYTLVDYVNEIEGLFYIEAKVGTERGGYQYVTLQVNIISSGLESIEFGSIPKLENGKDAFEYDRLVTGEYIAAFTFDPYMADIKNSTSYPATMQFSMNLNGMKEFNSKLEWNLESLRSIEPYMGGEYIVQALLPLDDDDYIPISVKILVLEKRVDTLNGQGIFNIFIDPLDKTPFARQNTTSMIGSQMVEVTFIGDDTKMQLNLTYNRKDILINFGGISYEVDAEVGNDFGGYQPLGINGKVRISIIQRDIEGIWAYNDKGEIIPIFERKVEIVNGNEVVTDRNPNTFYYNDTPRTIFVKFTGIEEWIEVSHRDPNTLGLSFEWKTKDVNTKEVCIYNIIPAFIDNEGKDTVYENNPCADLDVVQLQDVQDLLIAEGEYGMTYSNSTVDILGELRQRNAINDIHEGLDEFFVYEYYYQGEQIDPSTIMNSGIYTVRIYVIGHEIYGGYAEVDFTINRTDLSQNIMILRDGVPVNITGGDVEETLVYTGAPIVYTAKWSTPLTYTLIVNYPDGIAPMDVGEYLITIDVNDINRTVYNTIRLKIVKAQLDETSDSIEVDYTNEVTYGTNAFKIESLKLFNNVIDNYSYSFYLESECLTLINNLSSYDVGTYYVKIECDAINHSLRGVFEFQIVPVEIDKSQIEIEVADMKPGESQPQITLTVFGEIVDLDGAIITYYDENDVLVSNIEDAPHGQYKIKVEITLPNYKTIVAIGSFYNLKA